MFPLMISTVFAFTVSARAFYEYGAETFDLGFGIEYAEDPLYLPVYCVNRDGNGFQAYRANPAYDAETEEAKKKKPRGYAGYPSGGSSGSGFAYDSDMPIQYVYVRNLAHHSRVRCQGKVWYEYDEIQYANWAKLKEDFCGEYLAPMTKAQHGDGYSSFKVVDEAVYVKYLSFGRFELHVPSYVPACYSKCRKYIVNDDDEYGLVLFEDALEKIYRADLRANGSYPCWTALTTADEVCDPL